MITMIFFIIIMLLYALSLCNLIIYKVPHVGTYSSDFDTLREAFSYYNIKGKKIADLWSGTWKIVRLLTKEYRVDVTGYEIDFGNYYVSKIYNYFLKLDIRIIRWNYLTSDLKGYDWIYVYLFPCLMDEIEKKIFSECKAWTLIFVNAFSFKNHTPVKVFKKKWKDKIFVYIV